MSSTIKESQIQSGLSKVQNLGRYEETFEIDGQTITLRNLRPHEVERAQEGCREKFELFQESQDANRLRQWLKALQVNLLSYAVVQINETDLRGVDYIETDRVDPETGKPRKFRKPKYLRQKVLRGWTTDVIDACFRKFKEVTSHAEDRVQDQLEFEEDSYEEKIDHLEDEIDRLRQKQDSLENQDLEDIDDIGVEPGEGLTKEDFKNMVFNPEEVDEIDEDEIELGGGEEESQQQQQERQRQPNQPANPERQPQQAAQNQQPVPPQNQPRPQASQQQQEVEYVDQAGNPLTGKELEAAKRQDEMLRQRQEGSQTPPQTRPAEVVPDDEILTGSQAHERAQKVNAQKMREEDEEIPVAEGFGNLEPERLNQPVKKAGDEDEEDEQPPVNEDPKGASNPDFEGDL